MVEIVKLLVEAGASCTARMRSGDTPFSLAQQRNFGTIMQMIQTAGVAAKAREQAQAAASGGDGGGDGDGQSQSTAAGSGAGVGSGSGAGSGAGTKKPYVPSAAALRLQARQLQEEGNEAKMATVPAEGEAG